MRRTSLSVTSLLILAGVLNGGAASAQTGGYYYQPRSFYMTPPIYTNLSVFGQPPIVVYEPVVTYPAPVAGYYTPISTTVVAPAPIVAPAPATVVAPAPAVVPPGRVRERQISTPFHTRYQYKVNYPGGLEYKYRYKRDGGLVRFSERWGG